VSDEDLDSAKEALRQASLHYANAVDREKRNELDEAYSDVIQAEEFLLSPFLEKDLPEALFGEYTRLSHQVRELKTILEEGVALDSLRISRILEGEVELEEGESEREVSVDIPLRMNDRIQRQLDLFTKKNHSKFQRWFDRSSTYDQLIRSILSEEGLPEELVYMSMIESGFNPNAYSRAHAVGLWQFIRSTGRIYGLTCGWWLDERRDPVKSTRAACRYLKKLYRDFQDWELAMAAYNCGERRVEREIRRYGTRDFWKLQRLPRQTRNYVPKFMAARIICENPEKYGFRRKLQPPLEYDEVTIPYCTQLSIIARCCNSTYSVIKRLNPELRRWCTPPGLDDYRVKIPRGTATIFAKNYAEVPREEMVAKISHKVRRGETLSSIAKRYGTTVRSLQEVNRLPNPHRLRIGKRLLIPTPPANGDAMISAHYQDELIGHGKHEGKYRVRRGDNLSFIARRFGVAVRDLQSWNDLTGSRIYPGQALIVKAPSERGYSGGETQNRAKKSYTVKSGDTLIHIARANGIPVSDICRWNGISRYSLIYPGDRLVLWMPAPAVNTRSKDGKYTVRRGDNLTHIAKRYGISVRDLKQWNVLDDDDRIYPGQVLTVALLGGDSDGAGQETNLAGVRKTGNLTTASLENSITHRVRKGESIERIARRYRVNPKHIIEWNNLNPDNYIYPGDELILHLN
jgi:membrane-bound lytic murein transglycosylase D